MAKETLQRETLTTSVLMDHFSPRRLEAKSGYGEDNWPSMIVKETVDNGIDAAESAGRPPRIKVHVDAESIAARDNGDGLPEATLNKSIDYSIRVSDKARVIAPTRGSQGEALKQVYAVGFLLSGNKEGRVIVLANGKKHCIRIATDEIAGHPRIETNSQAAKETKGTIVKAFLPGEFTADAVSLAIGYACFNPHLYIRAVDETRRQRCRFRPTNAAWEKHLPTTPTSPHWWSVEDLAEYVAALVAKDREQGEDRTVRNFLGQFAGLTSPAKRRAAIGNLLPWGAKLSSLLVDKNTLNRELIKRLLVGMRRESKPLKPEKLGVIGEQHLRKRVVQLGGDSDSFRYKCVKHVGKDGLPYLIEVAFAQNTTDERLLICGVNWSAAIKNDPLDINPVLFHQKCFSSAPVIVVAHVACPKVHWADEGKTTASLPDDAKKQLDAAIEKVTAEWKTKQVAEERAKAAMEHFRQQMKKKKAEPKELICEAIEKALPEAVRQATGDHAFEVSVRNLFYAVRALVLAVAACIKDLNFTYFRSVLNKYQEENGEIELLYKDPRGYLLEPHTGRVVPLGTREVRDYQIPYWLYHIIIFVEKKGMQPMFVAYKLAERYDMAIVMGEGYAVDAAVELLRRGVDREMIICILHDADPDGYNIKRNVQAKLRKTKVKVLDLGLHLQEAIDMDLPLEPFVRSKRISRDLAETLSPLEKKHFDSDKKNHWDEKKEKRLYTGNRVELNALAANPDRFMEWLEGKLAEHGLDKKLVPPAGTVESESEQIREEELYRTAESILTGLLDLGSLTRDLVDQFRDRVELDDLHDLLQDWASELLPERWRDKIDGEISGRIHDLHDEIRAAAEANLKKSTDGD